MLLLDILLQVSTPVSVPYTVIAGGALTFTIVSLFRTTREGINYLKRLHEIPCHSCTYFTNNYCLKCTVHPSRALTEEAIACPDYEPATKPMAPCSQTCQKNCPWDLR